MQSNLVRPQKAYTVSDTEIIKKYGSLENYQKYQQSVQRQEELKKEVESFQSNLTYENYQTKYNFLSPEAKALVQSPEKIYETPEYQQYQNAKAEQDAYARAYEWINRKAQGKRAIFPQESKALIERLLQNPEIARAVEEGGQLRRASQKAGFKNVAEYTQVGAGLLGDKFKPLAPLTQPEINVSQGFYDKFGKKLEKGGANLKVVDIQAGKPLLQSLQIGGEVTPPQKPTGTYTTAPSNLQRYKDISKERGSYIEGVSAFFGSKAESYEAQNLQKKKDYYQYGASVNVAKTFGEVAPYFIPGLGAGLLIGGAVEKLTTPYGREVIEKESTSIQESYKEKTGKELSPVVSKTIAEASPVLNLFLGGVIAKAEVAGLRSTISARATPQTKFIAEETAVGDQSIIKTFSKTTQGENTIYQLTETTAKAGGGKSVGVSKGYIIQDVPITKFFSIKGYDVTRTIKPIQSISGAEVLGVATKTKSVALVKPELESPFVRVKQDVGTGFKTKSISKIEGETSRGSISGAFEQQGESEIFKIRAGTKEKTRIYREGSSTRIVEEPNIFGVVKRTVAPEEASVGELIGTKGGGKKTSFSKTFGEPQTVQQTENTISNIVGGIPTEVKATQIVKQTPRTGLTSLSILSTPTKTKEEPRSMISLLVPTVERTREESKVNTRQEPNLSNLIFSKTSQPQKEETRSAVIPGFRFSPKQEQKARSPTTPTSFGGGSYPGEPTTKIPTPFGFIDFDGRESRKQTQVGFDVYVKERNKFKKINERPMTERGALSLGGENVDRSLSAQFKIEPRTQTKTIAGKKEKVPKQFKVSELGDKQSWGGIAYKFRESQIRNRQEYLTPRKFIEREPFRIDSPTEKKQIKRARSISSFIFGGGNYSQNPLSQRKSKKSVGGFFRL